MSVTWRSYCTERPSSLATSVALSTDSLSSRTGTASSTCVSRCVANVTLFAELDRSVAALILQARLALRGTKLGEKTQIGGAVGVGT